jgi:uncharacterized membrane protein
MDLTCSISLLLKKEYKVDMSNLHNQSWHERFPELLAAFVGSWTFLCVQTILVIIWIGYNALVITGTWHFDPYPFIFLNLIFSLQSAYTAPIVMISQNQQDRRDRAQAEQTNQNSLLIRHEIAELHRKIDALKEK